MNLELEVLRDALIFAAKENGIEMPYNANMSDTAWNWNKEAVTAALGYIDYIRLTGELPERGTE